MPKYEEAHITIKKIGEKENKFWVQDTHGEFYSGLKEYQGTQNNEYAQQILGNHGEALKEGDSALISFTKTAGTDKEGNDKIYNNLKSIFPAQDSAPAPKTPLRSNSSVTEAPKGDVFWDKKAYKQCLWNYWLEHSAQSSKELVRMEMDLVWRVFSQIEIDANTRFDGPVSNEPALPTIHRDENDDPISVEDIPF